jgi:N utilization substance protein A
VLEALGQIAQEKNVKRELVVETLEIGLLSAAKKRYGTSDNIEVEIDNTSGGITLFALKQVVAEEAPEDSGLEIGLSAAKEIDPKAKVGKTVREELSFADFGRNAIQTAKQILIQRVREAERERIYDDYQGRIGEIVSGTVQQISRGDILVNLGRTEAVIPLKEQIRKERYRQGDPIRAYVVNVLRTSKGPQVLLSRTHPTFLMRLFQFEVPEIYEGVIEVKGVAREPGERAKIAVVSHDPRIDPVGACVGMKGSRVQAVVRELSNERIDIVPWNENEAIFLSRALSPAVVKRVVVERIENRMTAVVEDDQLSLAIGKSGQNARLAGRLTSWKVDIITETRFEELQAEKAATLTPLASVRGIGKVMRERLETAGIVSANDVVAASVARLIGVPGIGEATAEKIQAAADEIVSVKVAEYREALEIKKAAEEAERAALEAAQAAEEAERAALEAAQAAEEAAEEETDAEAAEEETDAEAAGGGDGTDLEATGEDEAAEATAGTVEDEDAEVEEEAEAGIEAASATAEEEAAEATSAAHAAEGGENGPIEPDA